MRSPNLLVAAAAALVLVACGAGSATDDQAGAEADGKGPAFAGGKADAWDSRNDPERMAQFMGKDLEYGLANLPMDGVADNKPWPASYWPTYQDSANYRWEGKGTQSPLEKYDIVFNGWQPDEGFWALRPFDGDNCYNEWDKDYYSKLGPAAKYQSEYKGNKRSRDGIDSDGDGEPDDCDNESNDGVEFWWGLCHAWAPAAMNEPEPTYPVTMNGVTFKPADIKALLMVVYDKSNSIIVGGRCNTKDVERDETGRITDPSCRDTNAGAFHVAITNFLGRYNMSIAEDRTYNYEVWNQPIHDFAITYQEEIDEATAIRLTKGDGGTDERYAFNDDAKRWAEVKVTMHYVTESQAEARPLVPELSRFLREDKYHYVLEMDGDGNVIGGEWIQGIKRRDDGLGERFSNQPDFLWASTGPSTYGYNTNSYVDYQSVKKLLDRSLTPPDEGGGDDDVVTRLERLDEPDLAIPDNDPAGVTTDLTVDDDVVAKALSVKLDIAHTYIGDLVVTLLKDGSEVVGLRNGVGGGNNDIHDQIDVPALAGKPIAGTYALKVVDKAEQDTGKIVRWGIVAEVE